MAFVQSHVICEENSLVIDEYMLKKVFIAQPKTKTAKPKTNNNMLIRRRISGPS